MIPRIALLILAAAIAIGVTSANAGAPLPIKGDFTCDSHADAEDSLALLTYLGNLPSQGPKNCATVGTVAHATNGMIAWESDGEIYTMNADGGNPTNITNNAAYDWYPMWSHDGMHIAFSSSRDDGDDDHLFIANPDGSGVTPLPTASNYSDESPSWSPDDRQIVFDSYNGDENDIFIVNADGTGRHGILTGTHDDFYPTWSPDGKHILFSSDRGATYGDLFTMNPNGTNVQLLLHTDYYKATPNYSPDGTKIAFNAYDGANTHIYVVSSSGGSPNAITTGHHDSDPSWSPDGNFILFDTTRNDPHPDTCDPCNYDIYRMDATGAHATRLTKIAGTNENGVWQPIPTEIEGDLNCDNIVNVQDLLASLAATAGLDPHLPSGCPPIVS